METVHLYSAGTKLAGDLFLPDSPASADGPTPAPGVAICTGWGGFKQRLVGGIAAALAEAGFAALTFDYRGYGDSDGPRGRLMPQEQVADVLAAATYLGHRPEVDPARLAVLGIGTGGAVAVQAASEDSRLGACICLVGFGDGERWLRSLRRYWEWRAFLRRLEADRLQRTLTGVSEAVDPDEILVRDPPSARNEQHLRETLPERRAWRLSLESAEAVLAFKPVQHVHRIAPRAVMFVGVEEDGLTPIEETYDLYAHAQEPKRLLVLRGVEHHQVYQPQQLTGVLAQLAAFLHHSLPPAPAS